MDGYGSRVEIGELSETERALLDAAAEGMPLVLDGSGGPRPRIRARVIREILLGRLGEEPDPGGIEIAGADVTGPLLLRGATCRTGLTLRRCRLGDRLHADDATIPWLDMSGSELTALHADRLAVAGDLHLAHVRGKGGGAVGTIRLFDARIGGGLNLGGAELDNPDGPALNADGVAVTRNVFLNDGFRASGAGEAGTVRLVDAQVTGSLDAMSAHLTNDSGPALAADRMAVDGYVFLSYGFHATCASASGAVRLLGARVGVSLDLSGAGLFNRLGPAVHADQLDVAGDLYLNFAFHGRGAGELGTLRLTGARVGGSIELNGSRVRNDDGPAADLRSATAGRLIMPATAICRGGGDEPEEWRPDGTILLDGLTYEGLDLTRAGPAVWLDWIRRAPAYAAQPYQQLADHHRRIGHDADARKVLIAQQDDLLRRGDLGGRWARFQQRALRLLLGYGYRTWRAVFSLGLVVLLTCVLGLVAGAIEVSPGRYATMRTGSGMERCSTVEQIGVGLDRGLPVINTGISDRCELDTTSVQGQVITGVGWLLQTAAWALATLVVAGYTGLVRRE